ncbi:hypothetical protein AC482_00620 [miscellaneous Crenarchaeota group-15 archaeon DG-45]|uniref:Uncharacterized protein n=1 Tax=miscellaneous Crenarchaeota group-15 archaeon DG-45 TaxID=1685127 RepID=A0A0M0BTH8_9ARCH|nr:MAG: hypothetical protein AC482_00620 [miscellaneous Crenarchaeota group-15 archaeon DG-45]
MRSFVKIYGPPVLEAIRALEKIAIDMPEVCIMDSLIASHPGSFGWSADDTMGYFLETSRTEVSERRCSTIISKRGEMLGEHDFFFEWFKDPTSKQLHQLIEKIDETLAPLGCKYTITTKE